MTQRSRWCDFLAPPSPRRTRPERPCAARRSSRFTGSSLDRASVSTVALQFPNFGADVRVQVCHLALVNPIERDAVGGQLERLIGGDALQAGFIGAPGGYVGA